MNHKGFKREIFKEFQNTLRTKFKAISNILQSEIKSKNLFLPFIELCTQRCIQWIECTIYINKYIWKSTAFCCICPAIYIMITACQFTTGLRKFVKSTSWQDIAEITFNWFSYINGFTELPNVSYKQFWIGLICLILMKT